MAKVTSNRKKRVSPEGRFVRRVSEAGRFVGVIDEADAIEFRQANTAFLKEVTSSKTKAIEALKRSGYLTKTGKISKRYR